MSVSGLFEVKISDDLYDKQHNVEVVLLCHSRTVTCQLFPPKNRPIVEEHRKPKQIGIKLQ